MDGITMNVNWTAVGVGALVAYLLGWAWYSPILFVKTWMAGNGLPIDDNPKPPIAAMLVQAVGTFSLSWVIGITAAQNALLMALLIVLTIVVLTVSARLYVQKNASVIAIDAGYLVLMGVVMIVCQGIF